MRRVVIKQERKKQGINENPKQGICHMALVYHELENL
jgi:hypothetical protein